MLQSQSPIVQQPEQAKLPARAIRQPLRRLGFRLITLAIGLSIAFLCGELLLRVFVVQEGKRLATYDEVLGWRGRPSGSGIYARSADNIAVRFKYNNLGFRDEDVTPKSPEGKRLLLLGDSFVENLEIDYPATFPAIFEARLQAEEPNWDVAVVGSQGYSTAQQLLAFQRFRPTIQPDLVLLCFYCGNDFDDNLRPRFASLDATGELVLPTHDDGWVKRSRLSLQRWLYESSHVVFLLKNSLESLANVRISADTKQTVAASEEFSREITSQLLLATNKEVRTAQAVFAVLVIPSRDDLVAGNSDPAAIVTKLCEAQQIPCLDLSPLLSPSHFFQTDIHFNVAGHQVVAQAIADFLKPLIDYASAQLAFNQPTTKSSVLD